MVEARNRRGDLARAAYELVAEAGLENLRTRDVAGRAGVNIATLHYYFATKEAVIAAVAARLVEQFGTSYAPQQGRRAGQSQGRIEREFANALAYLTERNDIVVVMQEMLLRARRDPAVAGIVEPVMTAWRAAIARTVAGGIAAGEFDRSIDPEAAGALITSAITGALFTRVDAGAMREISRALREWLAA